MASPKLEERIARGKRAVSLARQKGVDTAPWEKDLEPLEGQLTHAQHVADRTKRLLHRRGWCLWWCQAFGGEHIIIARDEKVLSIPQGYPVYTQAELERLFSHDVKLSTLRLIHEAKRIMGAWVITILESNRQETQS